jgi:NADPH:quinone reductase-like Zn-dependent oxidoreductase
MRAVVFTEYGPAGVLHVAEVPAPHPGPGQIRVAVRAAGVTPAETKIRSGALTSAVKATFPVILGFDAAGVVDEIGAGVAGVEIGDEVFGVSTVTLRATQAEHAVLAHWAPKPAQWSWAEAGGAASSVETSTRVLDQLAPGVLLINGAAGAVGTVAVQLAVARGDTVIGTAGENNHEFLRTLGAIPVTYGPGLAERVAAYEVDSVFDCAGGALSELIAIAGSPAKVVTIADFGAPAHGVHLSHGAPPGSPFGDPDPTAFHGLEAAVRLANEGRLRIPVAGAFPFADAAAAHELSETGHARGKIVLLP